jgi:hypothetical protein
MQEIKLQPKVKTATIKIGEANPINSKRLMFQQKLKSLGKLSY